MTDYKSPMVAVDRRGFLSRSSKLTLSGTAIALMSGMSSVRADHSLDTNASLLQDIAILNTAIAAEHEAIAAYQVGAESGLLNKDVLSVAVTFQGHHKEHVTALSDAVNQLGGSAAEPKGAYAFPVEKLKSQTDVLEFAAGLERGAVSAYAGAIPAFENSDLAKAAASILADETIHWAVLRQALDPVPGAFFS